VKVINICIQDLKDKARLLRKDVITMIYQAGDGHPGPSLSIADIVSALYFGILNIDPANPKWSKRDRFILSKGHACPVLYAALARRGFFSENILSSLRSLGSILQGHPDMKKTPGVDSTSGSLGNGLSIGLGIALAGQLMKEEYFTYVVSGDGELQEGVIWEAAMTAVKYKIGRLVMIIDHNGLQSGGKVQKISGLLAILPKWESFGWHCQEIDGHNQIEIINAILKAKEVTDRPSMILARTVKGKGVSFMEGDNSWHKRVPTKDEMERALQELRG